MKWPALLLVAVLVSAPLFGCSEEWEGFVYPNRNNLLVDIPIGTFKSLQECRAAAQAMLERLGALERGDYECGLNCKRREGSHLLICERTEE